MSRTRYKHKQTFEQYYKEWLMPHQNPRWFGYWEEDDKQYYLTRERIHYRYKSEKAYDFGLPREYRNMVNRQRRARDKFQLWKELKLQDMDYKGSYSKWNCKDSNAWGYW